MTKAERTRQFIIEKSAPIFNTKGIAGTAMSDIMEATKLAKGSLYVHFESKEDLSYCAVDYTLNGLANRMAAEVNRHATAKGKIVAIIDFFGNTVNNPIKGGCPMLNFGMEADDTNPVILQKVNKLINGILKNIASIIESGIKKDEFKKIWNAREFAIKALAMLEGGILISRVSGNSRQMDIIIKTLKQEIDGMSI